MKFLTVSDGLVTPESYPIEAVERKGVGHPDSLADALANEISSAYSRNCLDRFGMVLPHNIDKLYVGAGDFFIDYGTYRKVHPITVMTNGRLSDRFGDTIVDIEEIQCAAVWDYLHRVTPRMAREDLLIVPNATQRHRHRHQYRPKDKSEIHFLRGVKANDTSLCCASWPPTATEMLTYRLERYFWVAKDGFATPRFYNIGQDIKVFSFRKDRHIDVTLCVPTISEHTASPTEYHAIIEHHQRCLRELAAEIAGSADLTVSLNVNQWQSPYMLGIGTCVECGEEGLVGRGNNIAGLISSHRTHTQESWAGKNPVYHTGRVLGYLTLRLARAIHAAFGVHCEVSAMTQCAGSLLPPAFLNVATNNKVDPTILKEIIDKDFLSVHYLSEILSFRPWLLEL